MAGNIENRPLDEKAAKFVKKKAWWLGGAGVVVGTLVPPVAPLAYGVSLFEGVQWGVADGYENAKYHKQHTFEERPNSGIKVFEVMRTKPKVIYEKAGK
jgi:hypothetical protein